MFKPGFVSNWVKSKKVILKTIDGKFVPRPWQAEFFSSYVDNKDSAGFILNSPTGSGKSKSICHISSDILSSSTKTKIIIAVPQKDVGNGFLDELEYTISEDKTYSWSVGGKGKGERNPNNLCYGNPVEMGKIKTLIEYLTTKTVRTTGFKRVMLCTHQTLAIAFSKLSDEQKDSLKNLFIWIDEAHHIRTEEEEDEVSDLTNKLGNVVNYIVSNPDKNLKVGLVTATLFRGDGGGIIPTDADFHTYSLPYDKHFEENCRYLKNFKYDFYLTGNDWETGINDCIQKNDKTILYVPHPMSKYSYSEKMVHVRNIISSLSDDSSEIDMESDVISIKRFGKIFNVIDLVDDESTTVRERREKFISMHPEQVDLIVAINKFTEGSDWAIANKVIIVGVKKSLTQQMQMIGRLFRDHESKKNSPVQIIQIIPNVDENSNVDKDRSNINDYLKCIFSSFVFEMVFNPIKIKIKKKKLPTDAKKNAHKEEDVGIQSVQIGEVFNTSSDFHDFMSDVLLDLVTCKVDMLDKNPDVLSNDLNDSYRGIIEDKLQNYDIDGDSHEVSSYIMQEFFRRSMTVVGGTKSLKTGYDAKKFDYSVVSESFGIDIMGFTDVYSTGVCGSSSLKEFRKAILAYDDRMWEEKFEALSLWVELNGEIPKQSNEEFGNWIGTQRSNYKKGVLSSDRIKKLESIHIWIWEVDFDAIWESVYLGVHSYVRKNSKIPNTRNAEFGQWIISQRTTYNNNIMSNDRINKLEAIDGWEWDPRDSMWEDTYIEIKKYVNENGELPKRSNKEFGLWVQSQRSKHEKYKSSEKGIDRIEKLEAINGWFWDINFDSVWEQHRMAIEVFMHTNKKLPKQSEGLLGAWIGTQRQNYRKKTLTEIQINKLESITGWTWTPLESVWDLRYLELVEFVKSNKRLPLNHTERIGRWGDKQRTMYKNNKLSVDRINKLNSINGWFWNIFDGEWEEMLLKVNDYANSKGESPKYSHIDYGRWISLQRTNYKKGYLSSDKIDKLESVIGWKWDPRDAEWEEKFLGVIDYTQETGELPNQSHPELGNWIDTQRASYKNGKMPQARIEKLESLPMWAWKINNRLIK